MIIIIKMENVQQVYKYNSRTITGNGIYLRHVWGTLVPEFYIGGHNLAVSQITCLDSDRLMARKEEFLATMETIRKKNGLDIVLLMITNVLVEGSYLLYSGDTETIRQAFNITGEEKNCVFLSKIMSRKKQIIPSLSALWG